MSDCANCKTPLVGEYCHECGQQDRNLVRGAFSMFGEAVAEMFEWDSRVRRTFLPLFLNPGFLSKEWVAGRRASYVRPVRLYLFVSIVFFIVIASVTEFDTSGLREQLLAGTETTEPGAVPRRPSDRMQLNFPFLSEPQRELLRERVDVLAANPDVLFDQVRSLAPQMMFVLLPLFAMILKVLYLFAKRYYVEHLVLALHTHSFLFIAFMLLFALGGVMGWGAEQVAASWVGIAAGWLMAALWIWIPVYLWLAQRRFYNQGWFLTTVKYVLTGFAYFTMVVFSLVGLLFVSIMTA